MRILGFWKCRRKIEVQKSEDPNPSPNVGFVKENFIGPKFGMLQLPSPASVPQPLSTRLEDHHKTHG